MPVKTQTKPRTAAKRRPVLVAEPTAETPLATISAAPVAALPLSGWGALTVPTQAYIGKLGAYLATLPQGKDLPRTYEMVAAIDAQDLPENAEAALVAVLPVIEQMSRHGVLPVHLAARMGIDSATWAEAYTFLPQWRQAVQGGMARGIAAIAARGYELAELGDAPSVRAFLSTRGGFTTRDSRAPAVIVNVGSQISPVSIDEIDAMSQRQASILEDVDYSILN
ncbi:hypothetical protein [Acidisoma silvae]|uniref:Uncharacterized protein n=1 Tax=Acidisoma silvae TaxID=2802396 RepID=A0A963YY42_9PROT|nr:hypothetical protein [Acidisoma silvae]MCB8878442.1 hypothetical protein [Acidisoma silvae]